MRSALVCLAAALAAAQDLPISGIAGVEIFSSDLEKARQFYTGVLGYDEAFTLKDAQGSTASSFFKINDSQYVQVTLGIPAGGARLTRLLIETPDVQALRAELLRRGVIPGAPKAAADGAELISMRDPDGTTLDFVRYPPNSREARMRGKALGANRISRRLWHAGVLCADSNASLGYYRDKLGLQETWRGGSKEGETRWINLQMPGERGNYLELMLYAAPPTLKELGSMQHICLQVPSINLALKQVLNRGYAPKDKPQPRIGRNGRWQLNLFDPDDTRVELMEPKAVR